VFTFLLFIVAGAAIFTPTQWIFPKWEKFKNPPEGCKRHRKCLGGPWNLPKKLEKIIWARNHVFFTQRKTRNSPAKLDFYDKSIIYWIRMSDLFICLYYSLAQVKLTHYVPLYKFSKILTLSKKLLRDVISLCFLLRFAEHYLRIPPDDSKYACMCIYSTYHPSR
jgi:hypothetical protein